MYWEIRQLQDKTRKKVLGFGAPRIRDLTICLFSTQLRNVASVIFEWCAVHYQHYNDVIMGIIASQITSLRIVYSTVYSDADQIKHHSSASLAFVRGIHRGPVNSPHKWPVTRKMFLFDDVIMNTTLWAMYERDYSLKCHHFGEEHGSISTEAFTCSLNNI